MLKNDGFVYVHHELSLNLKSVNQMKVKELENSAKDRLVTEKLKLAAEISDREVLKEQ